MRRYELLLESAYTAHGWDVQVLAPRARVSRRLASTARKIAKYIEAVVLFPVQILRSRKSDVVHLADHSNAFWLLFVSNRSVVLSTTHDLIALRASRGEITAHRASLLGRAFQALMLKGLRRSSHIVAVSESTRADVRRLVSGIPTTCVPNPVVPPIGTNAVKSMAERGEFALLVASSGWRKRRDRGIRYWRMLRDQPGLRGIRLKTVGPPLTEGEAAVAGPHLASIDVMTGISDEELSDLYSGALVLLHPSAYEGFGWPVIEANASGTPVIASDIAVSREVGPQNIFIEDDISSTDWGAIRDSLAEFPANRVAETTRDVYSVARFGRDIHAVARAALGDEK